MYAMLDAVKIVDQICKEKEVRRVTVFTDSKATLLHIQSDQPGPCQALALKNVNWERELSERNIHVQYRWVPP